MSKRIVLGFLVVALVLIAGWGWAQQKPGAEAKPAEPAGRYAVSPAGDTAVMLDTATGKTWVLTAGAVQGEPSAWLPTVRLEGGEDVQRWLARQKALGERAGR